LGGVARRATIINNYRSQNPNVLAVDGGGWALGALESQKVQSLFIAEMMGHLGYSVVNVGPADLGYGVGVLREAAKTNRFGLVASNLQWISGKPVFDRTAIREIQGIRVGFLGVMNEGELLPASDDSDSLQTTDPAAAIRELLPALRPKVDVVVLFAHVSQRRTQQICDEIKGIDLAVSGGDGFVNHKPTEVGNDSTGKSLILEAGQQGKYVGALKFVVSETGKILRYDHQMHSLDKNVKNDSLVALKVEEFKVKQREVRKREAVEQAMGNSQPAPTTPAAHREKFLGAQVCARCHGSAYDAWKDTPHAKSFASLERKQMEGSAECLKCHVTGFNQPNGYPNAQLELGSVSCESCHGQGTLHGGKDFVAKPSAQSCTTCHDAKNSPKFDYATYWARMAHK
jgi:2',3'-cyclic-nucleotide 2'-phosphodiesterase (5'-nucleotidase family)